MGRVDLPPPENYEGYPPPAEDELVVTIERDWTVEEEKKAKRKLDLLIMPLLTMGFFCLRTRWCIHNPRGNH
jgi:hypothetical protein